MDTNVNITINVVVQDKKRKSDSIPGVVNEFPPVYLG